VYGHLVDQGLIDPATDTVIKKEREFEKGTFELVKTDKGWFSKNTATGEMRKVETITPPKEKAEIGRYQRTPEGIFDTSTGNFIERFEPDDPEDEANKTIKLAHDMAMDKSKFDPNSKYSDNFYDSLMELGFSEEQARKLSEINKRPDSKKGNWFTNWFKKDREQPKVEGYETLEGAGKPTFNEANVTALIDVISDDVTTAERAHLKGQGATDSDIDEAIRRKGSK